jgi:NAD(P)-dependent dehydrogenase (short-subunit alcohol dehydrogenase family)
MTVALVTGGASGIGEAAARRFVQAGWAVEIADINDERGQAVAAEIGATYHHLDVRNQEEIERVVAAIPRIDVLVNAGGVLQKPSLLMTMPMDEIDRIFDINATGVIRVSRAVAAKMVEEGHGAIVNIGSLNSFIPFPHPAYAMSKVAITRITEILACELGRKGVRVNAVAPGYTLTPAMQARIDAGERNPQLVFDRSAIPRFVLPEEVGEAIYFLASPAASAITGALLPVDCGWIPYVGWASAAAQPE